MTPGTDVVHIPHEVPDRYEARYSKRNRLARFLPPLGSPSSAARGIAVVAPTRPVLTTGYRHKMRSDVDVDVVHIGISHGAAFVMIVDQPLDDLALAMSRIEVDGVSAGVP